jgi:transcriptional regulator GlxA family with amidase domain
MFESKTASTPQRVAFLLLPDFSMMAFTSSVEPLRAANRLSGRKLYSWQILTHDGQPTKASNGIAIVPDGSLFEDLEADALFVCAGVRAERFSDQKVFDRLRDVSRNRIALGGVCTGSLALARAGLLDGYRCTIHWENVEGFVEDFPRLDITATLFEIDRDRYTCSGGTAPLDMMIYAISRDFGDQLAIGVAEQMLHNFVRQPHDAQRMSIQYRTGISNAKLLAVIAYMEAYLESPVTLTELAKSVDLSVRQLERLFRNHLGKAPTKYYLELRLQRARLLLRQTTMPILQVAVASGFQSASHFARCYRELFGCAPRSERTHPQRIGATNGNDKAPMSAVGRDADRDG